MCFVSSEWPPQSHQLTLKSTFLPNFNIFLKITFPWIWRTDNQIDASGHGYVYECEYEQIHISCSYILDLTQLFLRGETPGRQKKKSSLAAAAKA